eukprot:6202849-Pleurochrysis_carterae.AAC.1
MACSMVSEEKGRIRSPPHVQNVVSAVWVFALHRDDRRLRAQMKRLITGKCVIEPVHCETVPAHKHEKAVLVIVVRTHHFKFCLYILRAMTAVYSILAR